MTSIMNPTPTRHSSLSDHLHGDRFGDCREDLASVIDDPPATTSGRDTAVAVWRVADRLEALLVAEAFARPDDAEGVWVPKSVRTLAAELDVSSGTVAKHLRRLADRGVWRAGYGGGWWHPTSALERDAVADKTWRRPGDVVVSIVADSFNTAMTGLSPDAAAAFIAAVLHADPATGYISTPDDLAQISAAGLGELVDTGRVTRIGGDVYAVINYHHHTTNLTPTPPPLPATEERAVRSPGARTPLPGGAHSSDKGRASGLEGARSSLTRGAQSPSGGRAVDEAGARRTGARTSTLGGAHSPNSTEHASYTHACTRGCAGACTCARGMDGWVNNTIHPSINHNDAKSAHPASNETTTDTQTGSAETRDRVQDLVSRVRQVAPAWTPYRTVTAALATLLDVVGDVDVVYQALTENLDGCVPHKVLTRRVQLFADNPNLLNQLTNTAIATIDTATTNVLDVAARRTPAASEWIINDSPTGSVPKPRINAGQADAVRQLRALTSQNRCDGSEVT